MVVLPRCAPRNAAVTPVIDFPLVLTNLLVTSMNSKFNSRTLFTHVKLGPLALLWLIATVGLNLLAADSKSSSGWLLVCNKGDHSLGIIDTVAGKQIATVPEDGVTGHEVIASADGNRAFVPIYGDSGVGKPGTDGQLVRVIDIEKRAVVGTVDFGHGVRPHCAMIGPKNGLLYVTTELDKSIA